MMQTKYIIKMKLDTRPDLDYFYCGETRSGSQVFEFKKAKAKDTMPLKRLRDAFILNVLENGKTFKEGDSKITIAAHKIKLYLQFVYIYIIST